MVGGRVWADDGVANNEYGENNYTNLNPNQKTQIHPTRHQEPPFSPKNPQISHLVVVDEAVEFVTDQEVLKFGVFVGVFHVRQELAVVAVVVIGGGDGHWWRWWLLGAVVVIGGGGGHWWRWWSLVAVMVIGGGGGYWWRWWLLVVIGGHWWRWWLLGGGSGGN